MGHAGAEFWDQFFRQRRESGDDLDWEGVWTAPFLVPLREAGVRTILNGQCGTQRGEFASGKAVRGQVAGTPPALLGGSRHFGDTGPIVDLADGQDVS